ncbi:MAG: 3-isopropylmalate dehydrogenase [Balneolaceae bacterium]|nr:3-isopropylmalate dehydrogenase [Balneolaceae bacterium]
MNKKIAVLPGDGIGPEVTKQTLKVLDTIGKRFGHNFEFKKGLVGAAAIAEEGNPLPEETLNLCKESDAVLFGAIGNPKYDNNPDATMRPEQGLLRLRKELGLFANIRPVKVYESLLDHSPIKKERVKNTDMVVFRELTGGIYFGKKGRSEDGTTAFDHCEYSVYEIERIARMAFEAAMSRKKKLTLIDKANVLETSRLWRQTVQGIAIDYSEVEVEYLFVDNAAMQLIIRPNQFDVILTENMFGDIISDESSVIAGSIGLLPSASVGEESALYEPIHGSYPQAAGKDVANPIASILSGAMMLDQFGMEEEAELVRSNVTLLINKGLITQDLDPLHFISCSKVGDVMSLLLDLNVSDIRFENMLEGKLPVI